MNKYLWSRLKKINIWSCIYFALKILYTNDVCIPQVSMPLLFSVQHCGCYFILQILAQISILIKVFLIPPPKMSRTGLQWERHHCLQNILHSCSMCTMPVLNNWTYIYIIHKNEFECHSLRKPPRGKGDCAQNLALSGMGKLSMCERGGSPCLACKDDFQVVSINTPACCNNVTELSGKWPSVCTFQMIPLPHKNIYFGSGGVLQDSLPRSLSPQVVHTGHLCQCLLSILNIYIVSLVSYLIPKIKRE